MSAEERGRLEDSGDPCILPQVTVSMSAHTGALGNVVSSAGWAQKSKVLRFFGVLGDKHMFMQRSWWDGTA